MDLYISLVCAAAHLAAEAVKVAPAAAVQLAAAAAAATGSVAVAVVSEDPGIQAFSARAAAAANAAAAAAAATGSVAVAVVSEDPGIQAFSVRAAAAANAAAAAAANAAGAAAPVAGGGSYADLMSVAARVAASAATIAPAASAPLATAAAAATTAAAAAPNAGGGIICLNEYSLMDSSVGSTKTMDRSLEGSVASDIRKRLEVVDPLVKKISETTDNIHLEQKPVQQTVHMSFGHLITDWLASMKVDVSRGRLEHMTVAYSRISSCSFTKTGLVGSPAGVRWRDECAFGEGPRARRRGDAQTLVPAADDAEEDIPEPASLTFEETVDTRLEELTMEVADMRSTMDTIVHQQTSMQATLDTLVDLVSSWVTGHPSQSVPSTAPVPHTEDAAGVDSAAVPAPATTSAPSTAIDPPPSGDDLIEFYVPL
ncbi:uncharacterized protein LOC121995507 [Zingiber officinale]|uniref:uncharacterized protein LOC121995507 n=1 Tax=Zingiber officinale TaxID=94328 RepID=UPI001C4D0531|nr:uncharacterized protein LOC121995507 [Zingiber officinale]